MPSEVDLAKRELVKVLRALAAKYKVTLSLTRESSNQDVDKAFRRVSLKVHPDKGGSLADFQKLSATNDAWKHLLKSASAPGRPPQNPGPPKRDARAGKPYTLQATSPKKVYTVQGQATLLTYQSFSADLDVLLPTWVRFLVFVEGKVKEWGVKFWTATAETNEDGRHHLLGHPLVYARELIDVLTSVHAVRNAEPKVEIKCFQVLLTEKVSFNHSKILQRFVANFKLDRSAHISEF